MSDVDPVHVRLVEAILFASAEPVAERQLATRLPEGTDVRAVLETLREVYQERGVNLFRFDRSWAFRTAPDLGPMLVEERTVVRKLSRAAVETLAVIAYNQPVTRAEIEAVRGVQTSKGTLDVLLEEGWIRPRGRRQTPGRPMTWGTTEAFLDHFGLERLDDLPSLDELKAAGLLDTRAAVQAYTEIAETEPDADEESLEAGEPDPRP